MKILGIDPGIATTGFGVIHSEGNRQQAVEYGAILTKAHTPLPERLNILFNDLCTVIKKHKPVAMGIEELFFNKNVKTALIVGQARGIMLLAAAQHDVPIFNYTPPEVKTAVCGYGRADKKQVQHMVKTMLNLPAIPKPDDVADALAVAICHSHAHRLKSLV